MTKIQFIISKHGDPHIREMQILDLLTLLPLSNTFLLLPSLWCPFLLFSILWWMGGQENRGTHGRTDWRNSRCLQERTHTRTDKHLILLLYKIYNIELPLSFLLFCTGIKIYVFIFPLALERTYLPSALLLFICYWEKWPPQDPI